MMPSSCGGTPGWTTACTPCARWPPISTLPSSTTGACTTPLAVCSSTCLRLVTPSRRATSGLSTQTLAPVSSRKRPCSRPFRVARTTQLLPLPSSRISFSPWLTHSPRAGPAARSQARMAKQARVGVRIAAASAQAEQATVGIDRIVEAVEEAEADDAVEGRRHDGVDDRLDAPGGTAPDLDARQLHQGNAHDALGRVQVEQLTAARDAEAASHLRAEGTQSRPRIEQEEAAHPPVQRGV